MRPSDNTSSGHAPIGTEPPHSPVLPPWGTMAMPACAHRRTTADTSAVDPGRTTQTAGPLNCLRQSVR